jgi:hypothetical protein
LNSGQNLLPAPQEKSMFAHQDKKLLHLASGCKVFLQFALARLFARRGLLKEGLKNFWTREIACSFKYVSRRGGLRAHWLKLATGATGQTQQSGCEKDRFGKKRDSVLSKRLKHAFLVKKQ